jgi:hypothetical protein
VDAWWGRKTPAQRLALLADVFPAGPNIQLPRARRDALPGDMLLLRWRDQASWRELTAARLSYHLTPIVGIFAPPPQPNNLHASLWPNAMQYVCRPWPDSGVEPAPGRVVAILYYFHHRTHVNTSNGETGRWTVEPGTVDAAVLSLPPAAPLSP